MSQKPERDKVYWKKKNTLENLLAAMREKSRKPGQSEQELAHILATLETIGEDFEVLENSYRSDDTDPEREDFTNPPDPVKTNEFGIPTSVPERTSRITELTADKTIKDFRNQEIVEEDIEIFPQRPSKQDQTHR